MSAQDHPGEIRHSLAHLLAAAVLHLYPDTKLTLGPAVDNGFYYDVDTEATRNITEEDVPKIEQKMREILKTWEVFHEISVAADEARKIFAENPYKLELIDEIEKRGEKVTLYYSGPKKNIPSREQLQTTNYKLQTGFVDLCRGGHVEDMKELREAGWKLDRIAGAYWRGDEKNKMLTRIYGLAFSSKTELEEYQKQQEEAEKRDHRKLGRELGLFVFSDTVGRGLPLWTEKGATLRRILERFIVDEEIKRGYKHVCTPDIAKLDLYKKSGHYPYFKDSMYAPIKIDEDEFMLRPMTCPHHFELYASRPHSYKELPIRYAELAKLYRYEQSGELSGLIRVRSFCLADAHIMCADPKQAAEEIDGALALIEYIAGIFGLEMGKNYWYRLSLGDRANTEKYYKDDAAWDDAEDKLRSVLRKRNAHFIEAPGEAAFYGPKIDIQMKNVRGKDDTAFTVQYDFVMPKRFNLRYIDAEGKEAEPIVVHRSSIGAIERVIAFLIEHYSGAFPFWLAPVQVKILPVGEKFLGYAKKVHEKLLSENIRSEVDESNQTLGKKVRAAKLEKIPYWIVVGEKETKENKITLESRDRGNLGLIDLNKILENLK